MSPKTTKPIRIFYFTCLAVIFFCLLIWLSAAMTLGLFNFARYIDGSIGNYLVDKGVERIMRRILLFWIIIFFVLSLKKIGWQGWKDCGWIEGKTSARFSQFCWGIGFGLISLGSMAAMTIFAGVHKWKVPDESMVQLFGNIFLFAGSGLIVALIEETICRGILFRTFARSWTAWPAAAITSLFFGIAHFIGPSSAKFHGNSFMAASFNASLATLSSLIPPQDALIQFLNLILLGILLCVFVMRTKTIWMSVGAHAAWVFVIKLHSCFTVFNSDFAPCIWLGQRNDFMDSPITAFILFVLILLFGRHKTRPPADKNNKGLPFHIRGQTWYLKPAEIDKLGPFIDQGEDLFVHADILKTYQGCRVSKKAGLIFKKYWPKGGWDKIRFVFRPLRTRRAFLLSDNLIDCGLPTPPVLGWSASRLGQNQYEAMLVAEIQNAEPLTNWLEKKSDDSTTRLRVMEAYGKLAATFHQHGYSNRDLKHENVMCLKEKPWVLWVVDLDGVKKLPFINRRRAGRDLMRVGKSLASLGWTNKAEIDAFFKAYNSQVPARLCCYAFPRQ